ncbi:9174_t:CDS:1, partial [Ambispora leptoticha]
KKLPPHTQPARIPSHTPTLPPPPTNIKPRQQTPNQTKAKNSYIQTRLHLY